MIDKEKVLWWSEVQTDLITDEDGVTFGVANDLFNNHLSFYAKYADGAEMPILTDDIYHALDIFNGVCPNDTMPPEFEEEQNDWTI